jgi:predicted lipoprotein with Yx(FWY)xxD motif
MSKPIKHIVRGIILAGFAGLSFIAVLACSSNGVNTTLPTSTSTTTTPGTTTAAPSNYTIDVASKDVVGKYLVDGRGLTLYYTKSDRPDYSNLPDETLSNWSFFYVTNISIPSSLNAADFGTYTRDNNVRQTTYKGYPLYYFSLDKVPGDILGNNLSGVWFTVNPDNFLQ